MSEIDKLTGFTTKKFFSQRLEEEVLRVKRYKGTLSLLMCDPDYQLLDNDPYIKTTLNYAFLKQLGVIFRRVLRDVDVMCRYEGDDIAAMLPETGEEGALLAAERLRQEVERSEFKGDDKKPVFRVAMNVGVATFFKHARTANDLIVGAQKAVQVAIAGGGNRVATCPITMEEAPSQ